SAPKRDGDTGTGRGIAAFGRGAQLAGPRLTVFRGAGARLERALINFMIDVHTQDPGYTEIWPPFLANAASMTGTGQLPKFTEDMFRCEGTDLYMIPTAEVPVTNLHRDEILDGDQLPIYYEIGRAHV